MLFYVERPTTFDFSNRLRELRLACRWTQEKAAESCGIGYKLFQLYELGIKTNPGLRTIEKIAKGFGLEIHELMAPTPLPNSRVGKFSGKRIVRQKRRTK